MLLGPRYSLLSEDYGKARERIVERTDLRRVLVFWRCGPFELVFFGIESFVTSAAGRLAGGCGTWCRSDPYSGDSRVR